eukprot:459460_1
MAFSNNQTKQVAIDTIIWVTSSGKSKHETSILTNAGYSVRICCDTKQCIEYIKRNTNGTQQRIVGIITSMMHRGGRRQKHRKNGLEMIQYIKQNLLHSMHTNPVFAMNSSSVDPQQCKAMGINILVKPQTCTNATIDIQRKLIRQLKRNASHSCQTIVKRPRNKKRDRKLVKCPDIHLNSNSSKTHMKRIHIVHISDTHRKYATLDDIIPFKANCINILIHTGDFSGQFDKHSPGLPKRLVDFSRWFRHLPHHKKIIIAGNHDYVCSVLGKEQIKSVVFKDDPNVIYLQDDMVNIYGIKIYGTPWNHKRGMSFGASDERMKRKWKSIPAETDILITHQPPFDKYLEGKLCKAKRGNIDLWNEVIHRIKPKCHLFGHDHDYPGYKRYKNTIFINSAMEHHEIPHAFDAVFDLNP